jgi:addiction module HigA family antidote
LALDERGTWRAAQSILANISSTRLEPLMAWLRDLGVPVDRVADIPRGNRVITADMAERLGRYFRGSAAFWMNLQWTYDLRKPGVSLG